MSMGQSPSSTACISDTNHYSCLPVTTSSFLPFDRFRGKVFSLEEVILSQHYSTGGKMLGSHSQRKLNDGISYAINKYLRIKLGQVVKLPAFNSYWHLQETLRICEVNVFTRNLQKQALQSSVNEVSGI